MTPLVAITTTIDPEAGAHRRPQVALYTAYMAVFERLGLPSLLVTPAHTAPSVRRLVGLSAGLVLTGGEDVDPARYGERPIPELGAVSLARDEMEFTALDEALRVGVPILAICRGCQLVNVHFGGTLYQDLPAQRPDCIRHEQSQPWGSRPHAARVEPDSKLGRAIDAVELRINSYHHQAIRELARGLRAVAWAEDGLIEAVEHVDHPWLVGVQWHPERHEATAPEHDPDRRLFAAFARMVVEHAGG